MRIMLSIHRYLALLVVATALPFLVFGSLLIVHAGNGQAALIADGVRSAALGAASDVTRQIAVLQSLALVLADSRQLQAGDLAAFHDEASTLVRRLALVAELTDTTGQQLVNTAVPFGTKLPAQPASPPRPTEGGVSDLRQDPLTGRWVVDLAVPVMRNGRLVYTLTLQIERAIAAVLSDQVLPDKQNIGLVDQQGRIIFRARNPRDVVGLFAPADFLRAVQGNEQGSFLSISRTGEPLFVTFRRLRQVGWVLAVSVPRNDLFAPVNNLLTWVVVLGIATTLMAGLIAAAIGRSIARPIASLSRLAAPLSRGETIPAPPLTQLREVNAVAASMVGEAALLREQTEQARRGAEALRAEVATRQSLERQLVQSQKMEAVGQLTGGMAHDFNNLLAIIIGNLDAVRERCQGDPQIDELTEGALEAALQGAELTRRLLAFARRQPLAPERCDINQRILAIVRLLDRTLGEDIVIDLQLAAGVRPVLVDRVQFEAAIANLATNARDAMPDGGQLTIATRNTFLDEDYAASHAEVVPGDYVLVEVSDSGTGMPSDVLEHVFEPFFTTKEPGHGTGLGLSMVFGFIKQSGGHITAYSEVGEGTTFRLYLPPALGPSDVVTPVVEPAPKPGQNETVLAVEDSAGLRQVLVRQLTSAGYNVLQAGEAATALDMLDTGVTVDLLLTDIVMPGGMNGRELARVAADRRQGLKVLLTTGFSDMTNGAASEDEHRILRKPYRKDELLRVVRAELDR